jgi:hypothetical protein
VKSDKINKNYFQTSIKTTFKKQMYIFNILGDKEIHKFLKYFASNPIGIWIEVLSVDFLFIYISSEMHVKTS